MSTLLSLALLCAGALALEPDQGVCEGDDCIDGYVSLFQDKATLHKAGHQLDDASAHARKADRAIDTTSSTEIQLHMALCMVAGIVVFGAAFWYFLLRPAREQARTVTNRRASMRTGAEHEEMSVTGRDASVLETLLVNHDNSDDVDQRKYDQFDEDTYSLAVALIVRDLHSIASGKAQNKGLRYSRLLFSVGLIAFTVFIQVAVLIGTKKCVTPQQVSDIRGAYDDYEVAMYGEENTYLNRFGKHRGKDGYFNISKFNELDDDLLGDVCNIPLSQKTYIGVVLMVWAITCAAQLKKCVENFMSVIFFAETTESMADALTPYEDDDNDGDDAEEVDDGIDTQVITGLTLPVKVMLIFCVFLPDFCTTCYACWLGSRWLIATNDFGNLISNGVALEFLLMLKYLMVYALVSSRNRRDLDHTGLAPAWPEEPSGYGVYFNTTIWGVIALVWVILYMKNQQVLPDYKWDVHEIAKSLYAEYKQRS